MMKITEEQWILHDAFLAAEDGMSEYPYYIWCEAHGLDYWSAVSCYMTLADTAALLAAL
jgi:hypothetical protein